MPLAFGTRLGPYEILGLIGKGGMGEVYQAHDTKLKRDVALGRAVGNTCESERSPGQSRSGFRHCQTLGPR